MIRAVVLTGTGDRAFCSGMDLRVVRRGGRARLDTGRRDGRPSMRLVRGEVSVPVVGAANGSRGGRGPRAAARLRRGGRLERGPLRAARGEARAVRRRRRHARSATGSRWRWPSSWPSPAISSTPPGPTSRVWSTPWWHRTRSWATAVGMAERIAANGPARPRRHQGARAPGRLGSGGGPGASGGSGRPWSSPARTPWRVPGPTWRSETRCGGAADVRAAVCRSYGAPEVVGVEEMPAPELGRRPGAGAGAGGRRQLPRRAAGRRPSTRSPWRHRSCPGASSPAWSTEVADGIVGVGVGDRVAGTVMVGAFAEEVAVTVGGRPGRAARASTTATPPPSGWPGGRRTTSCARWPGCCPARNWSSSAQVAASGLAAVSLGRHLGATVTAVASTAAKLEAGRGRRRGQPDRPHRRRPAARAARRAARRGRRGRRPGGR